MSNPKDTLQFDPLMNCLEVTQRSMEFIEMYQDFAKWPEQGFLDPRGMAAIELRIDETIELFNGIVKQIGGIPVRVAFSPDQQINGQVTSVMGFSEGRWIFELHKEDEEAPEMLYSNTADLRDHHYASLPDPMNDVS